MKKKNEINNTDNLKGIVINMEKVYKTMKSSGIWNITIGIISICVSVFVGVAIIVNGARLLSKKNDILF